MDYRKEIDGLRALAVLPVILFHAGFQAFSGGFVGVDVFFVISGYLITSIILAEHREGTYSLVNFYERRARRILPALFVVMAACLPVAWFWLLPEDMKNFSESLVATSFFSSNILFWKTSNYFSSSAELKPLLHTWSLAVEEQYYVFFPIFLALTWRWGVRWLSVMLAVAAGVSLYLAHTQVPVDPSRAFYLLPTRCWELFIGALIGIWLSGDRKPVFSAWLAEAGSALGLAMLVSAIFLFDKRTPSPSLYTLVPTLGTALIILFASGQTLVGRFVGNRAFVFVGLLSYSAYLWHQPLFAFARQRSLGVEPGAEVFAALSLASVLLAYVSWKYVEAPFRNRRRFGRQQIFLLSAIGSAMFVTVGLIGHFNKGYPARMPASLTMKDIDLPKSDNGWCFYSIDSNSELSQGAQGLECWLGDKTAGRKGVLFGDSFAGQYEPLWDAVGKQAGLAIHAVTTNWCYPAAGEGYTGTLASRAYRQCLFNRQYLQSHLAEYDFAVFSGDWGDVLAQGKFDEVQALVRQAATKVRVVVLMSSPKQFGANVMVVYKKSLLHKADFDLSRIPTTVDKEASSANARLQALAQQLPNAVFVDRASMFQLDGQPSDLTANGVPYSWDGAHISIYGARTAAPNFMNSRVYQDFLSKLASH
ncbi:MAG TPA: acyltransferase family protein [Aquabacterium sp.]|uniref:acyltransferase family protein n=1 Tax=Aquabacterium sp. TaxID=1872578 RepID=UPI002E33939D|nr:acyltransferase family protein [Aquabacterium sp.]HEX5358054.1 acyltransferase family protein [Aquabacterium sp.]